MEDIRERLGRVVRDAWITWARTQPDTRKSEHPQWFLSWEEMAECDREVDRQIGMAVVKSFFAMRIEELISEINR
jgi:hypothetical protein